MNTSILNEKFPVQNISQFQREKSNKAKNHMLISEYYQNRKEVILDQMKAQRTPEDGLCSIYRIFSKNKSYIGSTKMVADLRFRCHANAYNRYKNNQLGSFCASFDVFDDSKGEPSFEILEKVPISQKAEREAYFISHFRGLSQVVNLYQANCKSVDCKQQYMRAYLAEKKYRNENLAFRKLCKITI
jgi:hypothetical protein